MLRRFSKAVEAVLREAHLAIAEANLLAQDLVQRARQHGQHASILSREEGWWGLATRILTTRPEKRRIQLESRDVRSQISVVQHFEIQLKLRSSTKRCQAQCLPFPTCSPKSLEFQTQPHPSHLLTAAHTDHHRSVEDAEAVEASAAKTIRVEVTEATVATAAAVDAEEEAMAATAMGGIPAATTTARIRAAVGGTAITLLERSPRKRSQHQPPRSLQRHRPWWTF